MAGSALPVTDLDQGEAPSARLSAPRSRLPREPAAEAEQETDLETARPSLRSCSGTYNARCPESLEPVSR